MIVKNAVTVSANLKPKPGPSGQWHDPELLEAAERVKRLLIANGCFEYADEIGNAIEDRQVKRQMERLARMSVRTY